MILGIDEVGRGALAGPLVVGAVVLGDVKINGLADSKQLSPKKRLELDKLIRAQASAVSLGWVSCDEIDQIGMSRALELATIRAIEPIRTTYHEIIIDGTVNFLKNTGKSNYVNLIKKADQLIPTVSAASIVAKVARDDYMRKVSSISELSCYGFDRHVGYGTASHLEAISKYGACEIHRLSFKPFRSDGYSQKSKVQTKGQLAESIASEYLKDLGYEIVARNWKTPVCEIDIIAMSSNGVLGFFEVKYRQRNSQGGGMSAITNKKVKQMKFAAEVYLNYCQSFVDQEKRLFAISMSGDTPKVDELIEII